MAIQIPSLDDRTYEQLVEVLRRQIPPSEWTDHNASDPGIMLLELLCWLGEMAVYRMDQVPESHRAKFLNFLIDPPEPVTVEVTFTLDFVGPGAPESVTIPAGKLLATDFTGGRRFVFETFRPLTVHKPQPLEGTAAAGTVDARAILEVTDEVLGVSDGTADQTFELRPPWQALGLGEDDPAPVLTDFVRRRGVPGDLDRYEPNPQVKVGPTEWKAVPSLRTEGSRVTSIDPAEHYMIEPFENRIRFGDGVFGAIPVAEAEILCARYEVLEGPAALIVKENDLKHVLNFAPPPGVDLVALSNTDAEGGANFFPVTHRFEFGLERFRAPFRLVTERDFERAIIEDFNEFQRLSNSEPQIARASVVLNRQPEFADDVEAPGYVTFVLLPGPPHFDEATFQDETVALTTKEAMVGLPIGLSQRLSHFLDRRRLITTRLRQRDPTLRRLTITGVVVVAGERNLAEMQQELRGRVYGFLSLLSGGFDGRGWKLGRNVYRSQLFRLIEDTDGVDHVASLELSPADPQGNVVIGLYELPLLERLTLAVVRA